MNFPDEGLWSHEESKGSITGEETGPSIVRSVESGSDLVKIVTSSHSIFPVVVLENVAAKCELSWISLGLFCLESTSTSESGIVLKEISIVSLGWVEPLVVEVGVSVQSSTVDSTRWSLWGGSTEASELVVDQLSLNSLRNKIEVRPSNITYDCS